MLVFAWEVTYSVKFWWDKTLENHLLQSCMETFSEFTASYCIMENFVVNLSSNHFSKPIHEPDFPFVQGIITALRISSTIYRIQQNI